MTTRTRRGTNVANQIHLDENRPAPGGKGVKRPSGSPQQLQKSLGVAVNPAKKTRTAFGDITNRDNVKIGQNKKGVGKKAVGKKTSKGMSQIIAVPKPSTKPTTVAPTAKIISSQGSQPTNSQPCTEQDMSWDILEISASQEDSNSSSQSSIVSSQSSVSLDSDIVMMNERNTALSSQTVTAPTQPQAWTDIDAENTNDPFQCSLYAYHIFEYYKTREAKFEIPDYLRYQNDLSVSMRSILVDWLVEVQENFELNHETLYLAVKLVDMYLGKVRDIRKDRLQLIGATAMFISSKFDERLPPVLDDFLYICDDAYKREELIAMEMSIFKAIDFDLGIPLSYRYLRRYAKCARVDMETLTLGRYILEMSLMDYYFARQSDSHLAASALRLAMRMKKTGNWDATVIHYTGCTEDSITDTVNRLNRMVASEGSKNLTTIRTKYSHKVFHEVAKIPALPVVEAL